MKKFLYALLAVAATLSFASCNEDFTEENGSDPTVDTGTLTFTLKNSGPETRSETGMPTTTKGVTIPLGDPVDGYNLYLEETITELGDVYAPETKGTPVYTENFSKMFGGKFYGIAYSATGTTLSSTPVFPDGAFQDNGAGLWIRPITPDPFESYDELQMFFHAPQTVTGMGEPQYSLASNGRAITTFTYTVPLNAADQQEILITGRSVTKAQAKEPIPILFHHALTGVKFATAYDNTGSAKTYITKVEIPTGLYRSATIRITASWENGVWVDDPDTHSSESTEVYNVSNGQQLKNNEVFTLDLTESDIVDFETGGQFANKGKYPDSFAAGGNTNNLNDSDASKTFWLIPQRMNTSVVMDVTFHVVSGGKDSGPITRRINLGQLLTNNIYWRAGQIRTFTLKPELLDVDIHDKVNGFEKTDVVITNTGNVDTFIRAGISANWFGTAGSEYGVAVGYDSATSSNFIPAWKMSLIGSTFTDNYGGSFTGLPGTKWEYNPKDGFFYYKDPVPAGQTVPNNLFTKYSVSGSNIPPAIYYLDQLNGKLPYSGVELVMDIPVQAIEAVQGKTYREAWAAVGVSFNND